RLEPIVENSACVEAGTTIPQTPAKRCQFEQFQLYYLRRDIPVCQRTGRLSCSDNHSPMKSKYRRFVLFENLPTLAVETKEKREIVLNRRLELYRGKYRCVQPKINLLKRRSYAREKQCFPVEPSGCQRGAFT
ncbi:hypothetical protein TNCV_3308071, partial [Trichonephila clavipes]